MSMAYAALVASLEEGVEVPSPREFTRIDCSVLPSRTVQSEKDACDINKIVAKFERTGMVAHLSKGVPRFLDVAELGDFKATADKVIAVERWFQDLPASVRKVFENDPVRLIEMANDPAAAELFKELELEVVTKKEEPAEPAPPVP